MTKQSALLVAPFNAVPIKSGGGTRIFHTIKNLSKKYNLEVWLFRNQSDQLDEEKAWLTKLGVKFKYFNLGENRFITSILHAQPYWFTPWWNQRLINELSSRIDSFDLVQVDGTQLLYLGKYLNESCKKTVFVAHDVSTISFWRRLVLERNVFKKLLQSWRLVEVYFYELFFIKKFAEVISMSEFDGQYLKKYFGVKNINVIPNGIERIHFLPDHNSKKMMTFGYIGGFSHPPNLEAVRYIIDEILPAMEMKQLDYRLLLAGEQDPSFIKKILQAKKIPLSKVEVLGYLKKSEDFYRQIDFLLAPIFAGSGTRIKVLESLSFGRAVITTTVGAEGIEIKSKLLRIIQNDDVPASKWVKEIQDFYQERILDKEKDELKRKLEKMTWEELFEKAY